MGSPENIVFILVGPKSPGNIGACCRALKVTGLSQLRLVNPPVKLAPQESWMAHGSGEILKRAQIHSSTADAVADIQYLFATTQRKRHLRQDRLTAREAARRACRRAAAGQRVGILFGPEDNGLNNQDLELCNAVTTIPSATTFPSLNLAQAVMIYAYEIFQVRNKSGKIIPSGVPDIPATKVEQLQLLCQVEELVRALPFSQADRALRYVRSKIFHSDREDVRFLFFICDRLREVLKK